jgi:hypothetical protein
VLAEGFDNRDGKILRHVPAAKTPVDFLGLYSAVGAAPLSKRNRTSHGVAFDADIFFMDGLTGPSHARCVVRDTDLSLGVEDDNAAMAV